MSAFHISINSPAGSSFGSFSSADLMKGDTSKITLSMVRNKSAIPNKYFFTADGKSKVDDATTLAYYMSLTDAGQKILTPPAKPADKPDDKPAENSEKPEKAAEPAPITATVQTFTIQVTDNETERKLVPMPTTNTELNKMLDGISNGGLTPGKMPTFVNRDLAALTGNFAANAGSKTYPEPFEMDGTQWNAVFENNRALFGFYYDYKLSVLVKAKKRLFKLRGAAPVGTPPSGTDVVKQTKIPAIPPFYIDDDASVTVTETRSQFQHTLVQDGFDSMAVGGSLGGGASGVAGSVQASFEKEHAWVNQTQDSSSVDSLVATYNFPRVIVELDTDVLELTEEAKLDALNVTDDASVKKFYQNYGSIFATQFTLGGYLHSTRSVSATERSSLQQVKDKTRMAAGFSIQTTAASGGMNFAKVNSTGSETGDASLLQNVHLTWDARGGDTLLCSNPPAWASTVKDHRLWRLMKQQRIVTTEGLIKDIDTVAWTKLDQPSSNVSPQPPVNGDDILKDSSAARNLLINALMSEDSNALAQQLKKYYISNNFGADPNNSAYNAWLAQKLPAEKDDVVPKGKLWGQLSMDQKIAFGLYCGVKGVVTLS